MSELKARLQKSITETMKAKDAARLQVLRLMFNNIRKKEIDDRKDLTDAEVEKVFLTQIKQVQESLDQAKTAARAESIAEAELELKTIKEFLPEQMDAAAVEKIVSETLGELKNAGSLPAGGAAMGALMKAAMSKIGSRAEGKLIQAAVKKSLGL
jgi:uncharacterized protein YqeY